MAAALRRPNALPYLTRCLRNSSPAPLATRAVVSRIRCYASKPNSDNKKTSKDTQSPPSSNLKHDASKPNSPSPPPKAEADTGGPKMSPITSEEAKQLDDLISIVKMGLPRKQGEILQQSVDNIKKHGIPEELRDLLTQVGSGKGMDMATSAKLLRMTMGFARQQASEVRKTNTSEEKSTSSSSSSKFSETSQPQQEDPQKKSSQQQQQNQQQQKDGSKGPQFQASGKINLDASSVVISAFVMYLIYRSVYPGENSRDITWQEFRTTFFDKGLVEKLTVINRNRVRVDLHRDAVSRAYPESPASQPFFHYYFTIGSVEAFERRLDDAQDQLSIPSSERIPVSYTDETSVASAVWALAPTVLLLGGLIWLTRRQMGGGGGQSGIFGVGKSRAKQFNHETDVKVKFKDVAGMDEAKVEIMEFVSFLKEPGQYQRLGAKIPRGAILSGPPGTGKTLLAKATAGESQVPFFSVSGSEFVEMFVGVGPARVRDLFAKARKNTPCIIFIDEIDAIGRSRAKSGNFSGGNDERESTLNQILTEMDGFNTSEQVVVLAGTNRPDILDQALTRPGRFDRHISIDRPTTTGRKQIFGVHLGRIVTNEDMDNLTGRLAALTPGFSGADIANCVNEAALIAARGKAASVTMMHFESAIERVIAGLEKKSLVLSPEEKRVVAYHEAGHAICGWYFKYADPLLKVSIIPRGQGALGYAQYLPAGDSYLLNVNQLMDRMAMTLGGRVSEEIHFETVTSGASDDFNKVTRMATAMVTKWGMSSKIGTLFYEDEEQKIHKPFSESTAQTIDSEVRSIVDKAYKQCRDLLTAKKEEVGKIAEELLKKEMLVRDDMVRILGKRPFEDNKEFEKYFGGGNVGESAPTGKSAPPPPPSETPPGSPPEVPSPA